MALRVKAVERLLKFDKESAGEYRYVMKPELYTSLDQKKVIREAVLRSGVSQGVISADDSSLFLQVYGCLTSFVVLFGFLNTAKGIALRTDKAVCQETAWRDGIKLDGWLLVWLVLVL